MFICVAERERDAKSLKNTCEGVTFSKVGGIQPATLLYNELLHRYFSRIMLKLAVIFSFWNSYFQRTTH